MIKAELRKIYLNRRKDLSLPERREKSKLIADSFFANFDLPCFNYLHCFLPIEKFNEIDTQIIFGRIWREFPQVATVVPRVNRKSNNMESLRFASDTELTRNSWEIDEPSHGDLIETQIIDAVLVPLLCFDARGFRVGYGKGFYDKLLKNSRPDCLKIGLSYFDAIDRISDTAEFDVKLDACISPESVWYFS